ncbi:MAG: DUF2023 family protein [Candidatus Aegiribacteria sp.]|nr:DUF2023 family protein [Candidatus Aegiribacteria sp.]
MISRIDSDLKVLNHHVYEYRKGLRDLVLHTLPMTLKNHAEERLRREGIMPEPSTARDVQSLFICNARMPERRDIKVNYTGQSID